tara:strand:+ start:247 stop:516 length:270 start_codon:yes stop_codon:yes gene_type:complete
MGVFGSFYYMVPAVLVGVLVVAVILMWLWNSTFPDVFNFKELSYWQALKILIISVILTGGGSSLLSYTFTQTITSGGSVKEKTFSIGFP